MRPFLSPLEWQRTPETRSAHRILKHFSPGIHSIVACCRPTDHCVASEKPFKLRSSSRRDCCSVRDQEPRTNGYFVDYGRQLLPPDLDEAIETAIEESSDEWDLFVSRNMAGPDAPKPCAGYPLVVKYMPSARAGQYLKPNRGLYIGSDYTFTWGKAVYVTGIHEPLSTAIYGRVGVVSWFNPQDPADWRVFDARDKRNQIVYLRWLELQKLYNPALLTVHSHFYLHQMRNIFRSPVPHRRSDVQT